MNIMTIIHIITVIIMQNTTKMRLQDEITIKCTLYRLQVPTRLVATIK